MIDHKKLRRLRDAARKDKTPQRFFSDIESALESGDLTPSDFSLRKMFEELVEDGHALVQEMDPRNMGNGLNVAALEAAGAISTGDFSGITNRLISTVMLEVFDSPKFLFDAVCTVIPTSLNGERVAGVGKIGDEAMTIGEGENYPMAGLGQEYVETPATTKRGFIVGVTKEALFFDQTGLVMQRAAETSEVMAINREKRMLDTALGITVSYKRNGDAAINTYQASTPFVNVKSSNALVDWTDIENAELLFDALTDPNTGEPISVMVDSVIVPSALRNTARRIINATEVRFGDGASATSQTIGANPLAGTGNQYAVLSNQFVKQRTSSDTTWFIGQPKKAFAYFQNWGPTSVQAPVNSEAEFTQDVVARFKMSERGAPAVLEPRRMVKCTQ